MASSTPGGTTTSTLEGLEPATTYLVAVLALDEEGLETTPMLLLPVTTRHLCSQSALPLLPPPVPVDAPIFEITFDDLALFDPGCSAATAPCAKLTGAYDLVPGRRGNAVRLNDVDGDSWDDAWLEVTRQGVLNVDGAGSLAMWVYLDAVYGLDQLYLSLVAGQGAGAWRFYLQQHPVNPLLQLWTGSEDGAPTGQILFTSMAGWTSGEWHHVGVTWDDPLADDPTTRLYVDGTLVKARPRDESFPPSTGAPEFLNLLAYSKGNSLLDEFRAYDVALTPTQMGQVFADGLATDGPTIVAGRTTLQLLEAADGFGVGAMVDNWLDTFATSSVPSRVWWELDLEAVDPIAGTAVTLNLASTAAGNATLTCSIDPAGGGHRLRWSGLQLPTTDFKSDLAGALDSLDVQVDLVPDPARSEIRARISVQNDSVRWRVARVTFPRLSLAPVGANPQTNQLLAPVDGIGVAFDDPFGKWLYPLTPIDAIPANSTHYPSDSQSMQWVALVDTASEQSGVYVSAEDGEGWIKLFNAGYSTSTAGAVQRLAIQLVTLSTDSLTPGNDHLPPWSVVLGIRDGSWYDMARRYREFALGQPWTAAGPLHERIGLDGAESLHAVPPALTEVGAFFPSQYYANTFGHPTAGLNKVLADLGAPPNAVLWHFSGWQEANVHWGDPAQMNDSPAIVPWEVAPGYVADGKENQLVVGGYHNPADWDSLVDTPGPHPLAWSQAQGEAGAMRDKDGEIQCTWVCPYDPDLAAAPETTAYNTVNMCPQDSGWQQVQAAVAQAMTAPGVVTLPSGELLLGMGFDGIYLDVVTAARPRICYSADHGHLPGGGTHYVQGYREMLTQMRTAAKTQNPDAFFYSEGFSEPYLDLVEGYFLYKMDDGLHLLPLASAVYHDFTVLMTWESWFTETQAATAARQSRLFVWGGALGYAVGSPDSCAAVRDHILELGLLRNAFRDYLVLGEMMRPPELQEAVAPTPAPCSTEAELVPDFVGKPVSMQTEFCGDTCQLCSATTCDPGDGPYVQAAECKSAARYPVVDASQWRGPGADAGLAVASLEWDPAQCREVYVPIVPEDLGFEPGTPLVVERLTPDGSAVVGTYPDNGTAIRVALAGGKAVALRFSPAP